MKRIRIMGLCLVAVCAIFVVAAGSASALPEFGHCVAKAGGKYTESNCHTKATGKAPKLYEFVKGAVKGNFTGTGGVGVLEGASGTQISCKSETAKGEIKGTKEVANVQSTFVGCELPLFSAPCQTKGDATGVIVTTLLGGKLSYTSGKGGASPVVNQGLTPKIHKKGFALFECPAVGVEVYVGEGKEKGHETILANLASVNTMSLNSVQEYVGSKGKQTPDKTETSANIDNLESSLGGPKGTFERSGQQLTSELTFEESLEVKA